MCARRSTTRRSSPRSSERDADARRRRAPHYAGPFACNSSADERTRTSTSLHSRRPERRASTNSATSAGAPATLATRARGCGRERPREARRRGRSSCLQLDPFATLVADCAPLSSRGLGRRPLTAETGVRIPVAVLGKPSKSEGFLVSGALRDTVRDGQPARLRHVSSRARVARRTGWPGSARRPLRGDAVPGGVADGCLKRRGRPQPQRARGLDRGAGRNARCMGRRWAAAVPTRPQRAPTCWLVADPGDRPRVKLRRAAARTRRPRPPALTHRPTRSPAREQAPAAAPCRGRGCGPRRSTRSARPARPPGESGRT